MSTILIKNGVIVNENKTFRGDVLIKDELIAEIGDAEEMVYSAGNRDPGYQRFPPSTRRY